MQTFESKLNDFMTQAAANWWNNLTKQELLDYLAAQENLTADDIRTMFSTMNSNLTFDIDFSTASSRAKVDFGGNGEETEEATEE